ncbi:hypothetical protein AB0940_34195 [Streptomyces sp. NPDC006656]|uniref:hypothetical protein n=1 Tax=Streptomyces sp. NPDC006656 TaxID=3156899 RepID=UPI003455F4FE
MADDTKQQEDDQKLRQAVYTVKGGWSPSVDFEGKHYSVGTPALAEVDGTLYLAHRSSRRGDHTTSPVVWTSCTPTSSHPQELQWRENDYAGLESAETPALVNDNGTLRMVCTDLHPPVLADALQETHLPDGANGTRPRWARSTVIKRASFQSRQHPIAPGMAFFKGELNLFYIDRAPNGGVRHLVRDAQGTWNPAAGTDDGRISRSGSGSGSPVIRSEDDHLILTRWGWPGNFVTAVHDGKLHLFTGRSLAGNLLHMVYDGTTWNAGAVPRNFDKAAGQESEIVTRRSTGLASFAGKLHAVYPTEKSHKLVHSTWTEATGWTDPVPTGHDSSHAPALLPYKYGPAGKEQEALLLVHRGIERYEPKNWHVYNG